MHMLASRALARKPRLAAPTAVGALLLGALCALHLLVAPVSPLAGTALAAVACAMLGAHAVLDARAGTREIARAEQGAVAALERRAPGP
jgi:hypothetical protein